MSLAAVKEVARSSEPLPPKRRSRAWEIVKCLGINAPGMTIKAALRTLGCWLTFGYL